MRFYITCLYNRGKLGNRFFESRLRYDHSRRGATALVFETCDLTSNHVRILRVGMTGEKILKLANSGCTVATPFVDVGER